MGYDDASTRQVERDELEARQRLAEARDKAEMNAARPRPRTTNSFRDSRRTGSTPQRLHRHPEHKDPKDN